jgi:hypothetical protein
MEFRKKLIKRFSPCNKKSNTSKTYHKHYTVNFVLLLSQKNNYYKRNNYN